MPPIEGVKSEIAKKGGRDLHANEKQTASHKPHQQPYHRFQPSDHRQTHADMVKVEKLDPVTSEAEPQHGNYP